MPLTQDQAFCRQARGEFSAYQVLAREDNLAACHALHVLQMSTEMLAKAVRLRKGVSGAGAKTHVAFSKVVGAIKGERVIAGLLEMRFEQYREFVRRVHPVIRDIEELHPQVGAGPNVEYPWEGRDSAGLAGWIAPVDHAFAVASRLRRPDGQMLLKLIHLMLARFDQVFG